jgi:hypothetical protein
MNENGKKVRTADACGSESRFNVSMHTLVWVVIDDLALGMSFRAVIAQTTQDILLMLAEQQKILTVWVAF